MKKFRNFFTTKYYDDLFGRAKTSDIKKEQEKLRSFYVNPVFTHCVRYLKNKEILILIIVITKNMKNINLKCLYGTKRN